MKHYLTLLLTVLVFQAVYCQQYIDVESFIKIENDLDARVHHVKRDQNGEISALIKVVTTQTGFNFEGGSLGIVAVEPNVGEIWVYVPRGLQRITIKHPDLGVLRNYFFPETIESAVVYEMRLTTGRIETTVIPPEMDSQWLLIHAEPETSRIYLDGNFEAIGVLQKKLLPGNYTYRIENDLYHTEDGRITVTYDQRAELNVQLKPNFGFIEVKSTPETGAKVLIDGQDAGFNTNGTSGQLKSGYHTVTIIKEQFKQATTQVLVEDDKTTLVNLEMASNFALVHIQLPTDAVLFINNERRTAGNWSGRLNAGVYTFEARMDKRSPARQNILLEAGDVRTIELNPQPITGSLDVISQPPQATIKLNGKEYGTTPATLRDLQIGDYTLILEKKGYSTVTRKITIDEGRIAIVNEEMNFDLNVTITSEPLGAELFIDDKKSGTTPYTAYLGPGRYNVRVKYKDREKSETINVLQNASNNFTIRIIEKQKVTISSNPSRARVFINKQNVGKTPYTSELDEGIYQLKLRDLNGILKEDITLVAGGKTSFSFDLSHPVKSSGKYIRNRIGSNYALLGIRWQFDDFDMFIADIGISLLRPFIKNKQVSSNVFLTMQYGYKKDNFSDRAGIYKAEGQEYDFEFSQYAIGLHSCFHLNKNILLTPSFFIGQSRAKPLEDNIHPLIDGRYVYADFVKPTFSLGYMPVRYLLIDGAVSFYFFRNEVRNADHKILVDRNLINLPIDYFFTWKSQSFALSFGIKAFL